MHYLRHTALSLAWLVPACARSDKLPLRDSTSSASSASAPIPVYVPAHLSAIAWPPGSPGPGFHGSDYTGAIVQLGPRRLGVIRKAIIPWGTGIMNEGYFVFDIDSGITPDSIATRDPAVGKLLWWARSYHMEWIPDTSGGRPTWFGGCLFVADDTLFAYGAVTDSSAEATAFAAEQKVTEQNGYYRLLSRPDTIVKVATLSPTFLPICRARIDSEQRGSP